MEYIAALRLRYFTPTELLRLFHFIPINSPHCREDAPLTTGLNTNIHLYFQWPSNVTDKTQYRLIGNSVNVEVVRRLVNYLFGEGENLTG